MLATGNRRWRSVRAFRVIPGVMVAVARGDRRDGIGGKNVPLVDDEFAIRVGIATGALAGNTIRRAAALP